MQKRKFEVVSCYGSSTKTKSIENKVILASKPVNAAMKAFNELCEINSHKKPCEYIIEIKEIDGNYGTSKKFIYKVSRTNDPRTVTFPDGRTIKFKYTSNAVSVSEEEAKRFKTKSKSKAKSKSKSQV